MPETLLTVLMPVYNGEKYLKESIDSIINQTYNEFEFLIINDGSTDSSDQIITSYHDHRIIYIKNQKNKGIVNTLNEGLQRSKGKYIARMDADDIALPNRLQTQINYMLAHASCHLCGSQAIAINEIGNKLNNLRRPFKEGEIKVQQLFRNCFIHPASMFTKKAATEFGYDINYQYAEDYLLFSQITLKYDVANLKEHLLYYRIHAENITSNKRLKMENSEMKVIHYVLTQLFDDKLVESSVILHHQMIRKDFASISSDNFEAHLIAIKKANRIKNIYHFHLLDKALQKEWFNFLYFGKSKSVLSSFINSQLFSFTNINFKQLFKLTIK